MHSSILAALPKDDLGVFLDSLPVGCLMLDEDLRIQYWNAAATRTLGYDLSDVLGKKVTETIFLNDAGLQFHQIVNETREARVLSGSFECYDKEGHSRLLKWRFVWLNDATKQLAAIMEEEETNLSSEVRQRYHMERIRALRTIDVAISGSIDFQVTLNIILQQMMSQLNMDAAVALVYEPSTNTLKYAAGRGLRTDTLQRTSLRIGEGYAGIAVLERKSIQVPNLRQQNKDNRYFPKFSAEGFVSYYCVPLIAKGQVKGVLESFHRTPFLADQDWLDFFEMFGGQAAIAIDNAMLFNDLQRSNLELMLAYDSTLEGWSKALDMRDRDTEGHTRRVTELTERLASEFKFTEEERIHIRRGAILHDIGKMGIPDNILLKEGPLSEEEWAVMRQHPVMAMEMLTSIAYLRPALDIPYCHHERWDGAGYPRGLKGEQIPLAARIFAVVDVFDALTSDRPYRRAWSVEDALNYIRSESGKHFDPKVVDVFMRVIGKLAALGWR